jgi:flavin reductase (DIM6/NTAB) family NADH-FMN oxidoreductase RutF
MSGTIAALFQRLTQGVYVVGVARGEVHNAFTAAWIMQVSYDPLLLALSINPNHSSYSLLNEGRSFSVNVLKKGQLDLADHFGQSERGDKLALTEWTTDRTGLPLLRDALAWFECQVVSEHPAGDHVLMYKPSPWAIAKPAQWTAPLTSIPTFSGSHDDPNKKKTAMSVSAQIEHCRRDETGII